MKSGRACDVRCSAEIVRRGKRPGGHRGAQCHRPRSNLDSRVEQRWETHTGASNLVLQILNSNHSGKSTEPHGTNFVKASLRYRVIKRDPAFNLYESRVMGTIQDFQHDDYERDVKVGRLCSVFAPSSLRSIG